MIILNRLEKFASQARYFLEMQFGFQEGSGCIEASFTIIETINHMLERGSKMFSYFLDVRKAFDTVWIDGLMYKLFSDLGVNGKLWLAIKDLYTDVNPIQAGVFWNHIGPLFLLYLWSNYNQTWHDGTLGQNLSKAIKILLTSSPGSKYDVIKPFSVSF